MTSDSVTIWIPGEPAPGGSKSAFALKRRDGSLVMRPDGKTPVINITDAGGHANTKWKKVCAQYAMAQMMGKPKFEHAIRVDFEFFIARPKYHYGTGKNAAVLKPDAPAFLITTPDLTKFIRSTEDALTGIAWTDDAIIVRQTNSKDYALDAKQTGCRVTITPLVQPEQPRKETTPTLL